MSRKVLLRGPAQRDFAGYYEYIRKDNPDAAERFLQKFLETGNALLLMPEMGRLCPFESPRLGALRFIPIKNFEKYLIFYRPTPRGILVFRILHSARDIKNNLEL